MKTRFEVYVPFNNAAWLDEAFDNEIAARRHARKMVGDEGHQWARIVKVTRESVGTYHQGISGMCK